MQLSDNIFISVIIPTYRPGDYIFECIHSFSSQTLSLEFFEVIIVLNGDKDPYYSNIIKNIENKPFVKLVYCEKKGVSAARNLGVDVSSGSHVLFIDDDDFVSESYLKEMYEVSLLFPLKVIASNFKKIFEKENRLEDDYFSLKYNELLTFPKEKYFKVTNYSKLLSSSCGKLIPKKVIQYHRFDESIAISEDALFMFEISKNIRGIELIKVSSFYYRRVRNASASRESKSISTRLKILFQLYFRFSKVYLLGMRSYSFLLYVNRMMAVTKSFINGVIRKQ